jgi:hypothetical protein
MALTPDDPKLLTPDQLAGIDEKLKRADENILNLGIEINTFIKSSPDSGITNTKANRTQQWINTHRDRVIPPRFGVLAGEIAHHWRSCLDHIAWGLSSDDYRRDNETAIAFPIFINPPNKKTQPRYDRYVEGITNTAALKLIADLQPHKTTNPIDDPLAIIHELDRVDKHHTLVLVVASFDAQLIIPRLTLGRVFGGFESNEDPFPSEPAPKADFKVSRQIAFAKFGQRENQAVVPSLTHLSRKLRNIVRRFSEL